MAPMVDGSGGLRPGARVRFSALYTSHFLFLGILLPFFSGWLVIKGFEPSQIGLINGVALVARLITAPLIALRVDRLQNKKLALILISALFCIAGQLLVLAQSQILIAIAAAVLIWCFGLLVPLSDSLVLRADRAGQLDYGRVRAAGSVAFLVSNIVGGALLTSVGLAHVGGILAVTAGLALGAALLAPQISFATTMSDQRPSGQKGLALLRNPVFLLALSAAGLTQGAHAVYYTYSVLHWSDLGYAPGTIGWLWATGVVAEIGLLTVARHFTTRLSPALLMGLGAGAATLRWVLTASEPPLPSLFLIQTLHALTFGAAYLGAVEFVDRAIPARLTNTGMVLFSTAGVGAMTGLATLVSGPVFSSGGALPAYLLMATMGAIGVFLSALLWRVWSGKPLID